MQPEVIDLADLTDDQKRLGVGPCWSPDATFWTPPSVGAGEFDAERWAKADGIVVQWGYDLLGWVLLAWRCQLQKFQPSPPPTANPDIFIHDKRVAGVGEGWAYEMLVKPKSLGTPNPNQGPGEPEFLSSRFEPELYHQNGESRRISWSVDEAVARRELRAMFMVGLPYVEVGDYFLAIRQGQEEGSHQPASA